MGSVQEFVNVQFPWTPRKQWTPHPSIGRICNWHPNHDCSLRGSRTSPVFQSSLSVSPDIRGISLSGLVSNTADSLQETSIWGNWHSELHSGHHSASPRQVRSLVANTADSLSDSDSLLYGCLLYILYNKQHFFPGNTVDFWVIFVFSYIVFCQKFLPTHILKFFNYPSLR